jgi:tetratricopeptide (TPR) repeat protein
VDAQLVECGTAGRYRMHDLLRLFAREQAGELPEAAALTRLLRHYTAVAQDARMLTAPDGTQSGRGESGLRSATEALDWFEAERANIVAGIGQVAALGLDPQLAIALAHTAYPLFLRRGPFQDWVRVNETAAGLAERAGDRRAQALAGNDLTVGYALLGRYRQAIGTVQLALAIFTEIGDRRGQARALNHLGRLRLRYLGQPTAAAAALRRSELISRELDDPSSLSDVLHCLGMTYGAMGRDDRAHRYLAEALTVVEQLGDTRGQAVVLAGLGELRHRCGDWAGALSCAERAVGIARQAGDTMAEAEALIALADLLGRQGQAAAALTANERCLALARELGDRNAQARCLRQLAAVAQAVGDGELARAYERDAVALHDELGLPASGEER